MNDKQKKSATTMKHVWMVEESSPSTGEPSRTFWTKIGVAFENEDGSLSLALAAIPVTGKMLIKDAAPTMKRGAA